jgi:hypothetical protein
MAATEISTTVDTLLSQGAATISIPGAEELFPTLLSYLANIPEVNPAPVDMADTTATNKSSATAVDSNMVLVKGAVFSSSGFGALNEPSSFHNKPARDLRRKVYKAVVPVMKAWLAKEGLPATTNYEQLLDRLLVGGP